MKWYYADDSDQQHEVDESDLASLVESGTIQKETLVWNETMADWKPALEAKADLFPSTTSGTDSFTPTESPFVSSSSSSPPTLSPYQTQTAATSPAGTFAQPTPQTDPMAVVSLVLGILGLLCFPLLGLGGVICGHMAYNKATRNGEKSANKGLALGGIITGYLGVLIMIGAIIFYGFAIFMAAQEGAFDTP